jgi:hypothetical protein
MADVRIQRLSTGDAQEHGAQHHDIGETVVHDEGDGIGGVHRRQHPRVFQDTHQPQPGDDDEPDGADGSEHRAHAGGTAALEHEQPHQDGHGDGDDHGSRDGVGPQLQALYGTQHRDGGREHAVAIEQGSTEDAKRDEDLGTAAASCAPGIQQRQQRQDAALPLVVGP